MVDDARADRVEVDATASDAIADGDDATSVAMDAQSDAQGDVQGDASVDAAEAGRFEAGLGYESVPACPAGDGGAVAARLRCDFAGACCPSGQMCANGVCTEELALHGGRDHMCLRVRGAVSCWGTAANGATGTSSIVAVTVPRAPMEPGSSGPVYGMANYSFTNEFIVGPSRSVGFWGGLQAFGNEDNAMGVSGPSVAMIENTAGMLELAQPSDTGVRCGVTLDRRVRCWGCGGAGALGDGTSPTPSCASGPSSPRAINLGFSERIAQVAVASTRTGDRYSAATVCALDETGGVRCWGLNDYGQRGLNRRDSLTTTSESATTAPFVMNIRAREIAALSSAFCAVRTDGVVVCWGNQGSYGGASGDQAQTVPEEILRSDNRMRLTDASMLRCGGGACCAVQRPRGLLFCWGVQDGDNRRIVPGMMMTTTGVGPTPIVVPGIAEGTIEALGVGDSICVIGRDMPGATGRRTMMCWGENDSGEAATTVSVTPTSFHGVAVPGL